MIKMTKLEIIISLWAVLVLSIIQPSKTQALTFPAQDPDSLPNTNFSCIGKVIGGYYADVYTGCQMFHVCTLDEKGEIQDYKFKCIQGTVFDQETRVCERSDEVDCSLSKSFFHLNDELYGPGIIPPTADTASTSSAATVQVLDPSVALLAATISPPASTDTSTGHPTSAPDHLPPSPTTSPSIHAESSTIIETDSPLHHHSHSPQSISSTSPPPPTSTPSGVTSPSASSSSKMSTSTSSSVTSAYSFPFTVSRTSTSVSSSSRVRIETPLIQISLNQDGINLPAPHLRPSLLRLAAQAQNSGQNIDLNPPTTPSPIRSRIPANFEDVPRLSVSQSSFSSSNFNDHAIVSSRQKRQTTQNRSQASRRNQFILTTKKPSTSETGQSSALQTQTASNRSPLSSGTANIRTSSRGRKRFRATTTQSPSSVRRNPLQSSVVSQNTPTRQRGQTIRLEPNTHTSQTIRAQPNTQRAQPNTQSRQANRAQLNTQRGHTLRAQPNTSTQLPTRNQNADISPLQRLRPGNTSSRRRQEITSITNESDLTIKSQQDSPIENIRMQSSQPFRPVSFLRPSSPTLAIKTTQNHVIQSQTNSETQSNIRTTKTDQSSKDVLAETFPNRDPRVRVDPLIQNDPTPLPPTVLTAELPPDSVHRVSAGAVGVTDLPTTTTTRPSFVFPETNFVCHDKVPGGLYADVETGCTIFHICSVGPDSSFNDNKFVCGEGTLFDQKSRTCQAASAVDCSISESLYHLNDRLKGPVFLELQSQLPEQQFDFPRIHTSSLTSSSSSSSSSSDALSQSRLRRNTENVVDLCKTQPLGTPLADLTSGCQNYMVCEERADGIVERHFSCKKDYLFSQIRKQCVHFKKVNCMKETLSGLLGLNSSKKGEAKKKMTPSLLSHRLRRAALPPVVNEITNAGMEKDPRVRRALFSLAALRRWAVENGQGTTFIEVYALNTKDSLYPKRASDNGPEVFRYVYFDRKKRDTSTAAEQFIEVNSTHRGATHAEHASVVASPDQGLNLNIKPTGTLPAIPTITIPPKTLSTSSFSISPTASFNNDAPTVTSTVSATSPTKISGGSLATFTISNTGPRTMTVTLPPATVTVTDTIFVNHTQTTGNPVVSTALPTSPQSSPAVSEEKVTAVPISPTSVVSAGNNTSTVVQSDVNPILTNSTPSTQAPTTSTETIELNTTETPSLTTENIQPPNTNASQTNNSMLISITDSSGNTTEPSSVPSSKNNTIPETPITASVETGVNVTVGNTTTDNSTTATTAVPSVAESVNASTTLPPIAEDAAKNETVTADNKPPASTVGPFTKENLPETNFTCKDKKLEQFYPDTEANCQVFHYCSPGFQDSQILDLKFLCTGPTMFDVKTQKCENMSTVTCEGVEPPKPDTITPATPSVTVETTIGSSTEPSTSTIKSNVTIAITESSISNTTLQSNQTTQSTTEMVTLSPTTNVSSTTVVESNDTIATTESSSTSTTEGEVQTIQTNVETETSSLSPIISTNVPEVSTPQTNQNISTTSQSLQIESRNDEVPTEIETETNIETVTTTAESIVEEDAPTTELGPMNQLPMDLSPTKDEPTKMEQVTEILVRDPVTTPVPPLSSTTLSQISSSILPTLNNTNISISNTTELNNNTNTQNPL